MSFGHSQKSNIDQSLSFEDVSKLFALPLSEAADILGVSTTVLKKLCNENGLERWPHRKYLAGKSIEEIKKEAAKEKSMALGGNSPKSTVTITPAATTTSGSHVKDKSPKSASEMSKSQSNGQQTGSKTTPTWRSNHMIASGLAIETSTLDEFKYGFPSNGLAKCTNRWWGSSLDSNNEVLKDHTKSSSEVKDGSDVQACDKQDEDSSRCDKQDENSSMSDKQDEDSSMPDKQDEDSSMPDKQDEDSSMPNKEDEDFSMPDKQDEFSLLSVRKRALEEGKKSLKLHALKKYGADKLGSEEKILLRRLYQTSNKLEPMVEKGS